MRRRATGHERDRGSSLAELLTSILVFGLVASVVTTAVVMTLKTSRATFARSSNLADVQVALGAMSKVIQTAAQPPAVDGATAAPAVILATPSDLKFFAYNSAGAPPAQIEFRVRSGGDLVETITRSTNTGANACLPPYTYGSSSTRVLARGVDSSAIFSYFGQPTMSALAGVAVPMTGNPPSVPTAVPNPDTPGVPDYVGDIELVQIDLSVGHSLNPSVAATHATITVSLPNHLVGIGSLPDSAC